MEDQIEKFTCDICKKIFSNKESMMQHKKDAHQNQNIDQKPEKKKINLRKILPYMIGVFVLVGIIGVVFLVLPSSSPSIGPVGSTHIHADIGIFLDGKELTPFGPQYFVKSNYIHVESGPGEGTVIHMHATNVPLNFFFKSLGMDFTKECFKTDTSIQFCNNDNKTLKMYVKHANVQWGKNSEYGNYIFKDLDKILITYGNENLEQIKLQQDSVTDFSK